MTAAELEQIESRLSVKLPTYYRDFVLAYPVALIRAKKVLGRRRESPAERQLRNDPVQLIEMNEDFRRPGTPWTADDGPWPAHYFAIGDDQCGNYWCIDLSRPEAGVWFYDHDTGAFGLQYPSLPAFADELLRDVESWNREYGASED